MPADDALCSACAGTGEPTSGLPCICGGTGAERDEILGLRGLVQRLIDANMRLRLHRAALVQAASDVLDPGKPLRPARVALRAAVDAAKEHP